MNKQDIDKAASALAGAINYFSPMVIALNQADEVFSSVSNALKLKESLARDVEALKSEIADYENEAKEYEAAVLKNRELVEQAAAQAAHAKTQAEKDIAAAKLHADEEVKSIKATVVERTKKAVADAEAKVLEAAKATEAAQAAHTAAVAELSAKKADLEVSVAALDKKLAALKEQAQKFAAALVA